MKESVTIKILWTIVGIISGSLVYYYFGIEGIFLFMGGVLLGMFRMATYNIASGDIED